MTNIYTFLYNSITILFYVFYIYNNINTFIYNLFAIIAKKRLKMSFHVSFKINEKIYLRDPESSEIGKMIVKSAIELINKLGFENFTFKKLATEIQTTEATIYRYFENKHRLLIYIAAWYWSWLEYQVNIHTNNIIEPDVKLRRVISILASTVEDDASTSYVNESLLHQIIIAEGSKAYLTKHVTEDNKDQFFKSYKDLCLTISKIIIEYNPEYKYPKSLSSSIIEVAHFQNFFLTNLPSLTDFKENKDNKLIVSFIEDFVFSSIRK